jgi:hypothetical protein
MESLQAAEATLKVKPLSQKSLASFLLAMVGLLCLIPIIVIVLLLYTSPTRPGLDTHIGIVVSVLIACLAYVVRTEVVIPWCRRLRMSPTEEYPALTFGRSEQGQGGVMKGNIAWLSPAQKVVMWVGILLVLPMFLFPPWQRGMGTYGRSWSAGYAWIGKPPYDAVGIDTWRILLQIASIGLVCGGMLITLQKRR